jgi:uncharacterized protein YjbJ (UPF0337 family)
MIMNKYQVKGESKIVAGKVQERVGKMIGSKEQQMKGQGKQITGHAQKGIGNIKQAVDDIADDAGNKY